MKRNKCRIRSLRLESLEERRMLSVNWVVNTASDVISWSESDTTISLREAVSRAGDGDTITFDSALAGSTISIKFGEMEVGTSIRIDASDLRTAAGTNRISLDALSRSRFFVVREEGSLQVSGLNLRNGYSSGDGGAIYTYGTLTVDNCNISTSSADYGGAIYSFKGEVTINGGSIQNNIGKSHGGGIYSFMGTLAIDGCTIDYNTAGIGGGIDCNESYTVISHSSISHNQLNNSHLFAGGIFILYGTMTIDDSEIVGNVSYNYGGGLYNYAAELSITNSLIAGNSAVNSGGGMTNFGYTTLTQCTVAGNYVTSSYSVGGGIHNEYDNGYGMYIRAYNCIIAGNICSSEYAYSDYTGQGYGYAYTSLLGSASEWTYSEETFNYSSSSPLFSDADKGDYSLATNSQAIDKGNSDYAHYPDGSAIVYDLAGNSRYTGTNIDLGAYEYTPKQQLATPSKFKATTGGVNRVLLSWDEVPSASGYTVLWSTDQENWTQGLTTTPSVTVTGQTYGETCYFKVKALGDGKNWDDSAYTAVISHYICPCDIDGDGFIGPGDSSIMSKAWFTIEGDKNWDQRADVDGDGFIGPGDSSYLSINWFRMPGYDPIINPPALAFLADTGKLGDSFETGLLNFDDFLPAIL